MGELREVLRREAQDATAIEVQTGQARDEMDGSGEPGASGESIPEAFSRNTAARVGYDGGSNAREIVPT